MSRRATCEELSALASHLRSVAPRRAPVHPLVLRHAEKLGASDGGGSAALSDIGDGVGSDRLSSWANTTRVFHLTHIAKAGGRSIRAEMQKLVRPVGGAEQCYPPFVHLSRINVVFLRHPRAHVISMYMHGAHSGHFARRRSVGYPWGNGTGGLVEGIGLWARHFADSWIPVRVSAASRACPSAARAPTRATRPAPTVVRPLVPARRRSAATSSATTRST